MASYYDALGRMEQQYSSRPRSRQQAGSEMELSAAVLPQGQDYMGSPGMVGMFPTPPRPAGPEPQGSSYGAAVAAPINPGGAVPWRDREKYQGGQGQLEKMTAEVSQRQPPPQAPGIGTFPNNGAPQGQSYMKAAEPSPNAAAPAMMPQPTKREEPQRQPAQQNYMAAAQPSAPAAMPQASPRQEPQRSQAPQQQTYGAPQATAGGAVPWKDRSKYQGRTNP